MDYTIHIGSSLNPKEKTVDKESTPRQMLEEMNIGFSDGQVQMNGSVLGSSQLNESFETLGTEDGDYITVVSKQDSGGKGLVR